MSFHKGMRILRNYGMAAFLKRFFLFLFQNIFVFKTYYLCRRALNNFVKTELKLKGSNSVLVIIHVPSEVDKLLQDGFDFGPYQDIQDIKKLLTNGAILFCIFFGKKWAHTSWASINSGSNIDPFFEQLRHEDEVCIGTCSTNPEYRGLGLYPYALSKICEFFKTKGISTAVISTAKNNVASIAGISKAGFSVHSEGYNLNILGFQIWRERQTSK